MAGEIIAVMACAGFGFIEKKNKKDQGAQDLSLVFCRPSASGVKSLNEPGKRIEA